MERRMPLVVSHYTMGTGYEEEVKHLEASLKSHNLDYKLQGIPSAGTWRANSNYCAIQVQEMLLTTDRDILRVDADARFQQFPSLFLQDDFNADIAAVIYDFPWHHNELMGGTLFFRNNDRVKRFVDQWARLCCADKPTERPGDLLDFMFRQGQEFHNFVSFATLPPTYCKIFDKMDDVTDPPVIEHFQASRRFKRIVNQAGRLSQK